MLSKIRDYGIYKMQIWFKFESFSIKIFQNELIYFEI